MGDALSENAALNAEHDAAMRTRRLHRRRITRWVRAGYEPAPNERLVRVVNVSQSKGALLMLEVDTAGAVLDNV